MSNTPMHGSDVQVTPEWWKASDGRFYPPELHPTYVKPAAPAPAAAPPAAAVEPAAASEPLSLVEQAKALADDAAAAARSTMDDAVPDAAPSFDPKATIPQDSPAGGVSQTIIHSGAPLSSPGAPPTVPPSTPPSMPPSTPPSMPPSMPPSTPPSMPPTLASAPGAPPSSPPSPGAPPSMPPGMPPAPGAPPSAPPGMPPAPGPRMSPQPGAVEQGPGGITYTAPQAPSTMPPPMSQPMSQPAHSFGTPTAPVATTSKVASSTSGLLALVAGAASIAGSLLLWGSGNVVGINGAEKGIIEVAGFDSSGLFAAIGGGVLILCAILFFMGVPQQTYWAGAAFITGAVIVGAVVFSAIDIQDLSDRLAAQFIAEGRVVNGDSVNVSPAIGLWISGAGGVLGVLAAPFVNRN